MNRIVTLNKCINKVAVKALLDKKLHAVIVKDFIDEPTRLHALSFIKDKHLMDYTHDTITTNGDRKYESYGVWKYGRTLNECFNGNSWEEYFQSAKYMNYLYQQHFVEHQFPTNKIITELNRTFGCYIPNINGNILACGIFRVMRGNDPNAKNLELKPHIDTVPRHILDIKHQCSANIYLDVPAIGGELVVYGDDGTLDIIKPSVRDLILISTERYHSVNSFREGSRITDNNFFASLNHSDTLIGWN